MAFALRLLIQPLLESAHLQESAP